MHTIKAFLKKREILHDFKKITKCQEAHLKELLKRKSNIQSDVFDATRFILEEGIDFYKSLIVLFNKGHIQSCLLMARPIVENAIDLQYIFQKDTEKRAKNYILHPVVSSIDKLKESEDLPGKDKVIEWLEQLKSELNKSGGQNTYWDGKNFKKICEELNQGAIYELWYTRLSKYIHSQYKGERGLERKGPYTDFIKRFISQDIMILTLGSLKAINEKYNLLEGRVVIKNYPHENAVLIFSISSKETDEKAAKQLEDKIKK